MSLTQSLGLHPGDRCCLVGAGGKTSCLYRLATEDFRGGTLATTTTKMRDPRREPNPFSSIYVHPRETFPEHQDANSPCFIASSTLRDNNGRDKVAGFLTSFFDEREIPAEWSLLLIEGDGAAGRPLKMPAENEPQIPRSTTVTVGVIGLDVLGKPAGPDYIHRFPLVQERIGIQEGESVSWKHLAAVVGHRDGLFAASPAKARRILLLNKADQLNQDFLVEIEALTAIFFDLPLPPERILLTSFSGTDVSVWKIFPAPDGGTRR